MKIKDPATDLDLNSKDNILICHMHDKLIRSRDPTPSLMSRISCQLVFAVFYWIFIRVVVRKMQIDVWRRNWLKLKQEEYAYLLNDNMLGNLIVWTLQFAFSFNFLVLILILDNENCNTRIQKAYIHALI